MNLERKQQREQDNERTTQLRLDMEQLHRDVDEQVTALRDHLTGMHDDMLPSQQRSADQFDNMKQQISQLTNSIRQGLQAQNSQQTDRSWNNWGPQNWDRSWDDINQQDYNNDQGNASDDGSEGSNGRERSPRGTCGRRAPGNTH